MSVDIIFKIAWFAIWFMILATSVFALWKGNAPERIGGALMLTIALLATVIEYTLQQPTRGIAHLVNDAMLAIGFLIVALRYASFWLGGAMILQAVQFTLHAYYFVTDRPRDLINAVINNTDTVGILLLLSIGTAISWRNRIKQRRAIAAKPTA